MKKLNIAAALAAVKPRERDEAAIRPENNNWKPYPCLLSRRELQKLVAEQVD
ncbi:hypothetical protein HGP17_31250 [Rhizobium sp. P38BS-XIX]|uniref:hypothetical protein n=1 Tax=Rhizobium sp. P38BS-XIX TaxID=2726740 RepID=UPI001456A06B|nr:hypothetical protein [Rhizobium sp. P38BS-XIX]NLS01333.1 hypothetical protein [Rhizobium sp. P38BS-XIX]